MRQERQMVVIQRNGRTTVVTGWRAVLLGLGAMLGGMAALVFVGFVVPAAIAVAILGSLFGRGSR